MVYVCTIVFLCSSEDGHGCFQILATVESGVGTCWIVFKSAGCTLGSGLLGHMARLLVLLEAFMLFSTLAALAPVPSSRVWAGPSHWRVSFPEFWRTWWTRGASSWWFSFAFSRWLMTWDTAHVFVVTRVASFENWLLKSFACFSTGFFLLLLFEFLICPRC